MPIEKGLLSRRQLAVHDGELDIAAEQWLPLLRHAAGNGRRQRSDHRNGGDAEGEAGHHQPEPLQARTQLPPGQPRGEC